MKESQAGSWIDASGPCVDRRQAPRTARALPILVIAHDGRQWRATSLDVARFGIKLDVRTAIEPGVTAWLSFGLPDAGPPVQALGLLVRDDPDGQAFFFVVGRGRDARRLDAFLGPGEPCGSLTSPGSG